MDKSFMAEESKKSAREDQALRKRTLAAEIRNSPGTPYSPLIRSLFTGFLPGNRRAEYQLDISS